MAAISESTRSKHWLKLAVVPLLLGVLGFVIWSNKMPTTVDATSIAPGMLVKAPSTPTSASTKPIPSKKKRVAWPKFSNEQILATNPFRSSNAMRAAIKTIEEPNASEFAAAKKIGLEAEEESAQDPWAGLIEAFPGNSIGVYIESSKGPALKIGSRLLHVGDRIGDSYRITGIRPDGIVVEAAPALK